MFKEMICSFNAIGVNDCKCRFVIEREISGCSKYGDHSSHTLTIYCDDKYNDKYYFDTRYDCISTENNKWVAFWFEYLLNKGYKNIQYNSDLRIDEVKDE